MCDFKNCQKSFTRNEELTRHRRIHSGIRPYQCRWCDKKFGRKDHLRKHERTHERRIRSALFLNYTNSVNNLSNDESGKYLNSNHNHFHPHANIYLAGSQTITTKTTDTTIINEISKNNGNYHNNRLHFNSSTRSHSPTQNDHLFN